MTAVKINVIRSNNKERVDRKGCTIDCTSGKVRVADRKSRMEQMKEWENIG